MLKPNGTKMQADLPILITLCYCTKLNQDEVNHLKIAIEQLTESVIINASLIIKNIQDQIYQCNIVSVYQNRWAQKLPIFYKIEKERSFSSSFYGISITLRPKPGKDHLPKQRVLNNITDHRHKILNKIHTIWI